MEAVEPYFFRLLPWSALELPQQALQGTPILPALFPLPYPQVLQTSGGGCGAEQIKQLQGGGVETPCMKFPLSQATECFYNL